MKKSIKKQGFTLVEIMIVVAIIGLLAAIGIPSFKKAREGAMQKAAANNTRLLNAAVDQYAIDKGLNDTDVVATTDIEDYLKGGIAGLTVGNNSATVSDTTAGGGYNATNVYPNMKF